jgi:hypothetical protein
MNHGEDRYARLAARVLVTESAQSQASLTEGRRDAIVAAMALAIAEKRRRRRIVLVESIALAAAAVVLLMAKPTLWLKSAGTSGVGTLLVERSGGSGNALVHDTVKRALVTGDRIVEGDALEAEHDGSVTLGFANGTRVTLSAAARLHVDELAATRRFSLRGGSLEARVAKLGQGERFIVDTPDAEVEVRGTVFAITIAEADRCPDRPSRSTVAVGEGAVWVRSGTSQVLLHPGESWTQPCAETAPSTPQPRPKAESAASAHRPATRPTRHASTASEPQSVPPPAPAAVPPAPAEAPVPFRHESHLTEQNDLFSAAMAAEHRGDHVTALSNLDRLVERFPHGPLAESARAERQRILSARSAR